MVFAFGPAAVSGGVAHAAKPVVTHVTFRNGFDVVVVENHAAPLAVVAVWYANGSVGDPPGRTGLAHALEHMLYRGTHALSAAAEFELDARLGIEANAGTTYESTDFHEVVPVERVELAMRVEAARMRGALLRARDWSVERRVVLAELRARQASRSLVLREAVRQVVYAGTPYAHGPGGTVADVSRITVADMRRAYERAYNPRNATLVVTGDVAPARIVALARTIFGKIAGGTAMPAVPDEIPVHRGRTIRVAAPGPDTLVDIALESPPVSGSAEAIASELLDPAHDTLSFGLVYLGPCSSYDFIDDTQAGAGLYHVICHLERGADPREPAAMFSAIVRGLAARHDASTFAIARRAVAAAEDAVSDNLETEAEYFGSSFASGMNPNHFRFAAPDAEVAAMLRRWSTPLAVGILSPAGTLSLSDARVVQPATNGDAPHGADPSSVSMPAWVRHELARPAILGAELAAPSWFALPNGVRLVVLHRPGGKHAYVRAGFDDANLWGPVGGGVARVAGNIFVMGSRRWPAMRVTDAADRHAISVDFDAESNLNGFATDLPLMFEMLASTWRAPQIDQLSVRQARRNAIREAERVASDPDRMALNMVTRRLGRPSARDTGPVAAQRGADASVSAVHSFFRAHVRPERAWVAVVGDVDPVSVYRQATRAFGGWRVGSVDPPAAAQSGAAPDRFDPAVRRLRVTRSQTRVLFGAIGPKLDDPDHDGMTLLHAVLVDGMDARLMRALRVRRGLAYSVSGSYDDTGRLLFLFECAPRDRLAASALLRRTLDDLAVRPPSSAELDRARGKLIGEALREQGSASGMLDMLAAAARARAGDDGVAALDARYRAIRADDLARIARSYLNSRRFFEVDEGP
jgi:zinc protease